MNRYSTFLVPVIMIFFLSNSFQQKKKNHTPVPEGISRWTGTVTFVEIINIDNAAYTAKGERHITASFNDALPTLYRNDETTELNFTDDKGPGKHTFHSEGQFIGGSKCVTDCESTDKAELHAVVINEEESVYDIEVVSPTCIGTTCGDNGGTKEFGPESRSITVSNHPLVSKDALSGTITRTSELPDGSGKSTATTTITWHLVRSKSADVELIVIPDDYENWLPAPGRDELSKGSVMTISLELRGRDGNPLEVKAESFELRLSNTSREPGITINYPISPQATQLPDLRFLLLPNIESVDEDQFTSIGSPDGLTGKTWIASYDGGGWTTLTVEAILEDKRHIKGQLLVSGGETDILIPKRRPGSKIADYWLNAFGNPGELDDKETSKGNTNNGDGLTAYEEYRGVISMPEFGSRNPNRFGRLDPREKEVGVKMKKTEIPLFFDGIVKFEIASGLKVIRFSENEIGADRKLNKNSQSAHVYDQYALFLLQGTLTGDLGKSFGSPAIPKLIHKTVIDQNRIRLSYQDRLAEANSIHESLGYTEKDLFATVTAHELTHSVNVPHHGSLAPNNLDLNITVDRSRVRIFNYKGVELQKPQHITGRGGDAGNEQSGDVNCFMLNNALCDWAVITTPDSMFFYQVPLIPLGTKLCTNQNGTGLNSLKDAHGNYKYFGDAVNGNCLSRIKLK